MGNNPQQENAELKARLHLDGGFAQPPETIKAGYRILRNEAACPLTENTVGQLRIDAARLHQFSIERTAKRRTHHGNASGRMRDAGKNAL